MGGGKWSAQSLAMVATWALAFLISAEAIASDPLQVDAGGPSGLPEEIVFAVPGLGTDGHYYANFGYFSFDPARKAHGEGGKLCRLNLPSGRVTILLEDLRGAVRDPQVHYDGERIRFSRHILYNLTRPEKSLLLLAPLSREAGGYGICRGPESDAGVFSDRGDRDYLVLLESVREAKRALDGMKRFDMPGFRPGPEYLREMARFGILASGADAGGPMDVYALDREYWRSLWYSPAP